MVAGEASGDYLAAGLIRQLKETVPDVEIEGIGGPLMAREGAVIHHPMDTISIMGVDGLAKSLWKILRIRKAVHDRFVASPPDVFVGVDVPDFNLSLERRLKRGGDSDGSLCQPDGVGVAGLPHQEDPASGGPDADPVSV